MKREGSGQAGGREDLGDPHHRQSHPGQEWIVFFKKDGGRSYFLVDESDEVMSFRRLDDAVGSCAGWASSSRRSICRSGVARTPLASLARPRFFLGEPVLAARLGRLAAVRRVAPTGQANGQQGQPGIQGMSAGGAVGRGHPGRAEDAEARVAALLADGRRFAEQHVFQGFGRADARARRPVARRR